MCNWYHNIKLSFWFCLYVFSSFPNFLVLTKMCCYLDWLKCLSESWEPKNNKDLNRSGPHIPTKLSPADGSHFINVIPLIIGRGSGQFVAKVKVEKIAFNLRVQLGISIPCLIYCPWEPFSIACSLSKLKVAIILGKVFFLWFLVAWK